MNQVILDGLLKFFQDSAGQPEHDLLDHLSNELTLRSYIAKGEEMQRQLPKGAAVLDWGAGFGQMSYIMHQLGLSVTPYDVVRRSHTLFGTIGKELIFGDEPVVLPFPDNTFDGVLSCGVLEHVPDDQASVREIYRILKPGGKFFIYNLPYVLSPSEYYATLRGISVHPIKYTKRKTRGMLEAAGFFVDKLGYENGIPKRLSGPLASLRGFADQHQQGMLKVDAVIAGTPLLRSLISNSITAIGKK